MLERWTLAVIRWRFFVIAGWVLILVLGSLASIRLTGLLTTSLSVPGSDSARANVILMRHFDENIEGTFTVVVPFNKASPERIKILEHDIALAARTLPKARITQERALLGLLYVNVGTSLSLKHASIYTGALRQAVRSQGLTNAMVTGPPALESDLTPILNHDLRIGELLAIALALLLLVAILGLCGAVLVPFLVAGATSAGALGVIFLLAHRFLMVLYIPNVIELIGLGLAIDYSLLIVHRFRTETLDEGTDVSDAIVRTMSTAGRTIVLSGLSVAIGLATLLLVPVPFVRSLGAAGVVVPVVALAAALTLQPAVLSLLGRRGVRPLALGGLLSGRDVLGGAWARVGTAVLRRPVRVLATSLVILAVGGFSILWFQLTPGSLTAIPPQIESARAIALVQHRAGPAIITPLEIVIDTGGAHRDALKANSSARLRLAETVLRANEVFVVATGYWAPYVDSSGRYARLFVISRHAFGDESTQQLVRNLRQRVIPTIRFPAGTTIYVAGAAAQGVDYLSGVYDVFPWIVALVLLLAYLILMRAFRSLLLALLAVVLDLLSVGVAYGLLVAVFRFGVGSSWLGTYRVGQIEGWVPIFIFAMLFGLSSDYEVFIVARMREARDRGATTHEAIVNGLANTGGVVTCAAAIMICALSGLVFGHIAGLQELGVGLALGVLVDTTIIRGLLLPSVMALLGRWNWWLPSFAARLVMVRASPLEQRRARPSTDDQREVT